MPRVIELALLRPYWLTRRGEWHRLVTSGFVHADFGHLLFNLITFYFFAFPLERAIGTGSFLILYFVSLVLSDLGTWYKHRNNPDYASLGASGAILGVLFASIVYFPDQSLFIIPIPVPMSFFSFGGWRNSLFGDLHVHGLDGVRFYTRLKTVTSRWPDDGSAAPGFHMPVMG